MKALAFIIGLMLLVSLAYSKNYTDPYLITKERLKNEKGESLKADWGLALLIVTNLITCVATFLIARFLYG